MEAAATLGCPGRGKWQGSWQEGSKRGGGNYGRQEVDGVLLVEIDSDSVNKGEVRSDKRTRQGLW